MMDSDQPDPTSGGDWFDQNPPPAADPFVDQLTALYAKYGRGAPSQDEINAHRGNPGGLAAIEALLDKDNKAANYHQPEPPPPPPLPTPPPAPVDQPPPATAKPEPPPSTHGDPLPPKPPQTYGPDGPTKPTATGTTDYGNPYDGRFPDIYVSNTNAPEPPPDMPAYVPKEWTQTAPTATKLAQYRPPTLEELKASPGYMARLDATDRAFQRGAAGQGTVLNGGTVRRAGEVAQDFASNEYDNLVGQGLAITGANNAATSGDNSNAYEQYVTNYGTFKDNETRSFAARQQNFTEGQAGYKNRYAAFLDANSQTLSDYLTNISTRRNTANDYWAHLSDLYGPGANIANGSYKGGVQL